MITKEQWEKISSQFEGHVYQRWESCGKRLKNVAKVSHIFKGRNVLEIGCNSGMMSLVIPAHTYVGLEANESFYKQALITKKHLKFNHTELANTSFGDYDDTDYVDGIICCHALYHLDDDEVKKLRKLLDNGKAFLFTIRNKKENNHKNKYDFYTYRAVLDFVKDYDCNVAIKNKYTMIWGTK